MIKAFHAWTLMGVIAIGAAYVGCAKKNEPAAPKQSAPAPAAPADPATSSSAASAKVSAALASLSSDDRRLAMDQKICPVSGEELGSMGTPIKLTAGGRDVFICCEGCKEPLEKEPAKYLAKLDAPK